jgi:hypothetical protein
MKGQQAKMYFEDRFNCAQSVLKAFQTEHAISDESIEELHRAGGGRVEGGLCGALHAGRILITDARSRAELDRRFEELAGALQCRNIRKINKLKCSGCVETVARLVSELKGNKTA